MMDSMARVMAVCLKELTQLRRDKLTFGMVIMIPLMQLLMFGYSINTKVRGIPIAICDHSQTAFSRQMITDLMATTVVSFGRWVESPAEIQRLVRNGKVSAGLYIPTDSSRRYYAQDREPMAQLIVDGSDTVMGSALKSLGNFPFEPGEVAGNVGQPGSIAVTMLYNPASRSELNTVPGLLGVILTMTMCMFTAVAIVRERERGNMELLIATPVKTGELMVGKLMPYVMIGLVQTTIVLTLGWFLFQVPIVGGLVKLLCCCLLFIFANLTMGLLISTIAPNQLGAIQLFIFIFLPSILLSGFMFPFQAMPAAAQRIAEVLPMTHFMRIVRGVILKDSMVAGMQSDLLYLAGFFVVTLMIAIKRFSKKLD